jgi:hypothetical protein
MSFLDTLLRKRFVAPHSIASEYDAIVAEIFAALAPNVSSRNISEIATGYRMTETEQKALIVLWNKKKTLTNRFDLWKQVKTQPTRTVLPILMALYFGVKTEEIIRQEILIRHVNFFKNMFDIFLNNSLPVGSSITSIWSELPPHVRNRLAADVDTPLDILYFIAQDKTLHTILARNSSIDNVIIDMIIKANSGSSYDALLRTAKLSKKHLEDMWKNYTVYDATFFLFFVHPNTPRHLLQNFKFNKTSPEFNDSFFKEYIEDDDLSDKNALTLLSKVPLRKQNRTIYSKVIEKIFESESVDIADWLEYVNSQEDYGGSKADFTNLKNTVSENMWDDNHKDNTKRYFEKTYDIDVTGYSLNMIRSILDWEE